MVSGVIEYAQRMDIALREVLPEAVIGTYLHGSGALGGFVHGLSDVDLLFVIADTGHSRPADKIGRRLAAAAAPCHGRGLEASVVTETPAHDSSYPFVVHLSTDPADRKIISGENHPGDPDLLMHVAVACAAGIAISGPPPTEVFLAPSRRSVLNYLVRELDDSLGGPFAYAVLTRVAPGARSSVAISSPRSRAAGGHSTANIGHSCSERSSSNKDGARAPCSTRPAQRSSLT